MQSNFTFSRQAKICEILTHDILYYQNLDTQSFSIPNFNIEGIYIMRF